MREDFRSWHPVTQLLTLILIGFGAMFVMAVTVFLPYYLSGVGLEVLSAASTLTPEDVKEITMLKLLQMAQAIGLFVAPYLIYRWVIADHEYQTFLPKRLGWGSVGIFALATFAAFPLINFLAEWNASIEFPSEALNTWVQSTEERAEALIRVFLSSESYAGLMLNLLVIALVPAIGEEMLFRGTFQPLMIKTFKGNVHLAIWVTAFWFSFLHLQFLGFVPRFLLGAALGYAAHWSGSLIMPMVGHFINNALAVIIAFYVGIESLNAEAETLGADRSDLVFTLTSVLIYGLGLYLIWKRYSRLKPSADRA